jgi:ferredoxin--NADP+ reductase
MTPTATQLGTPDRPVRVAIVGSGPSGFFAADYLLKSDITAEVHMFERLPTPYGLVRFGVAADHGKIRNVIKTFESIASHRRFHFWGHVHVGPEIRIHELKQHFDAIVLAYGSETDRNLNFLGEALPRSYTATEFCAWCNGHPDYRTRQFDLRHQFAVTIGQGNVAMDVVRILAKDVDELRKTDMASHALEVLSESLVTEIYCIGRRGPAQAAFTPKEIAELGQIPDVDIIVDPEDLKLDPISRQELNLPERPQVRRNMAILHEFAQRPMSRNARKRIYMLFLLSPAQLDGDGGVDELVVERTRLEGPVGKQWPRATGELVSMPCGVFFRAVGYHGMPIPGIPFDQDKGVVPNEAGRVEPGTYAVGWIKRGPSGLIGTNKKCSHESMAALVEDLPRINPAPIRDNEAIDRLLEQRGVEIVNWGDWKKIDAAEIQRGQAIGRPRDNFTQVREMLQAIGNA